MKENGLDSDNSINRQRKPRAEKPRYRSRRSIPRFISEKVLRPLDKLGRLHYYFGEATHCTSRAHERHPDARAACLAAGRCSRMRRTPGTVLLLERGHCDVRWQMFADPETRGIKDALVDVTGGAPRCNDLALGPRRGAGRGR